MKTHEAIKQGLVEAIEEASWVVEGGDAHDLIDAVEKCHAIMADALALIQRLEANDSQVRKALQDKGFHTLEELLKAYSQVKRERDAAVACIPRSCGFCKWHELSFNGLTPNHDCKNPEKCLNISGINTGWEWRGVPEREDEHET